MKTSDIIIFIMALTVPVTVLPRALHNAFNMPKNTIILMGVSLLLIIYCARFFWGKPIRQPATSTPVWVVILILLNFMSFLYTENYYFTKIAALLNISCLLFFFFVSLHIDEKSALWIIVVVAFSGILVSISVYSQFADHPILFNWARGRQVPIMGTIGNPNYLGAYLLFPLFALSGLVFLLKGKLRLVSIGFLAFVFGALLCSRARASWLAAGFSIPLLFFLIKWIYNFSVLLYIKKRPKHVAVYVLWIILLMIVLWSAAPERFHFIMKIENWTETTSLKYRLNKYWAASWWLFKQNPLFGNGLWSYRNMVYDAQAEIDKKHPGFFKDYSDPKPRRVHNEYLEILNDGGLVAAGFLLIFFVVVMGHGLCVIRDDKIQRRTRVVAATTFSAMVGIMIAALFFFPFRINSTLFMTALMMGVMEGIYLRSHSLIPITTGRTRLFASTAIFLISLSLVGVLWFGAYKPIRSERAFLNYKKAMIRRDAKLAEKHILTAMSYDPGNSLYCMYAGQLYMRHLRDMVKAGDLIDMARVEFNGDLTKWSVHFTDGLLKLQMGNLLPAQDAFKKAIYYNPEFKPAQAKLKNVQAIIAKYDRITIKIR